MSHGRNPTESSRIGEECEFFVQWEKIGTVLDLVDVCLGHNVPRIRCGQRALDAGVNGGQIDDSWRPWTFRELGGMDDVGAVALP